MKPVNPSIILKQNEVLDGWFGVILMKPIEPIECPMDDEHNFVRVVFAENQPQYQPLPAIKTMDGRVITEWELTAEELAQIMESGRLRLTILTFGQPLQPVKLEVA